MTCTQGGGGVWGIKQDMCFVKLMIYIRSVGNNFNQLSRGPTCCMHVTMSATHVYNNSQTINLNKSPITCSPPTPSNSNWCWGPGRGRMLVIQHCGHGGSGLVSETTRGCGISPSNYFIPLFSPWWPCGVASWVCPGAAWIASSPLSPYPLQLPSHCLSSPAAQSAASHAAYPQDKGLSVMDALCRFMWKGSRGKYYTLTLVLFVHSWCSVLLWNFSGGMDIYWLINGATYWNSLWSSRLNSKEWNTWKVILSSYLYPWFIAIVLSPEKSWRLS